MSNDKNKILERDKNAAQLLRIACIRAGYIKPRDGDPDERKIWNDGQVSRGKTPLPDNR